MEDKIHTIGFIMDLENPPMEFISNGTFQIGGRTVYMIDSSPYDLHSEDKDMLILLDGKSAILKSFEHDLMNRQNRPLVDKGQPTGLMVEFL